MVLRFSCPCGAPYALADHLAGRTFKCTQCQRTLKIGKPAAAPPPPSDEQLMASMEWSSEFVRPKPQELGLKPVSGRQPPVKPKPKPKPQDAPLDLAPDPDDDGELFHSLDVDADPPPKPARPKLGRSSGSNPIARRGSSGRLGRSSAGRKALRTSSGTGRTRGRRTSGRRQVEDDPQAHSMPCPVCEEVIARIAKECPSCGVVLRGPSALDDIGDKAKKLAGPVVLTVGVLVAAAVGMSMMGEKERPGRGSVKVSGLDGDGSSDEGEPPSDDSPAEGPSGEGDGAADPPGEDPPGEDPPAEDPPEDDPPDEDPGSGTGDVAAVGNPTDAAPSGPDGTAVIPEGPMKAACERLRDAPRDEVQAAIDGVIAQEGAAKVLGEVYAKSLDLGYRLRVHRARLRLGTAEDQRKLLDASLNDDSGDILVHTVLAAVALDRDGYRERLLKIPYQEGSVVARLIAEALLGEVPGAKRSVDALEAAHAKSTDKVRLLVTPLLLEAGRGDLLLDASASLDDSDPLVVELTKGCLVRVTAGLGPAADAGAEVWKDWVASYAPLRDILAKACSVRVGGPPVNEVAAAKRSAVAQGTEILGAIPVYMRDGSAGNHEAGRALGDIIARAAGPEHVEQVTAILAVLDSSWHKLAAMEVIRGCLNALDAKIAGPAIEALLRVSPNVGDVQVVLPLLIARPKEKVVEPLKTFVEGLSERKQKSGRNMLYRFRGEGLEEGFFTGSLEVREVPALAALLGSRKYEKALLKMAEGGDPLPGLSNATAAVNQLGEVGTTGVADRLFKLLGEGKDDILQASAARALQRLAGPDEVSKLRKAAGNAVNPTIVASLFRALEEVGNDAAISALEKRTKKDDPQRGRAMAALLRLGSPVAREEALAPFERWEKKEFKYAHAPKAEAVNNLVRCGKSQDGALLEKMFELQTFRARGDVVRGIGMLNYKKGIETIEGFLVKGQKFRGMAAAGLTFAKATDRLERFENLLSQEEVQKQADPLDCLVAACMVLLDPEAARPLVQKLVPGTLRGANGTGSAALAFALTVIGDSDSLDLLAAAKQGKVRSGVARGAGWAALVSDSAVMPSCLDLLRYDTDPYVQLDAAVARGFFLSEDAVLDLGLALTHPPAVLDSKYYGFESLKMLAGVEAVGTLRAALWEAYDLLVQRGKGLRFRDGLSNGLIHEHEREIRSKAKKS